MTRILRLAGLASLAALLAAQQFKFNLEHLAGKASNVVDVSLNGSTLRFAARFLDESDPDEAAVKKMINGLDGIYIKSFEFKQQAMWSDADLNEVRGQLRAPEWSRMVGYKSTEDGENDEIWVRTLNKRVSGIAIICSEPKSLTVVNIAGAVDLDSLAELGGHFGIPKLEKTPSKKGQ